MKRFLTFFILLSLIMSLSACESTYKTVFIAKVLENDPALLIEPQKDSIEFKSADKIVVYTIDALIYDINGNKIKRTDLKTGQSIQITYNGTIEESYPAQLSASKIKVLD